jgi:hypothetical protein
MILWYLRYVFSLVRIYYTCIFPARRYISKYKTLCFSNATLQSNQFGCRASVLLGEVSWDNKTFILETAILTC